VYTDMYRCICVCIYLYICVYICVYTHTMYMCDVYIYMREEVAGRGAQIFQSLLISLCIQICTDVYVCVYIYMCVYICVYTHKMYVQCIHIQVHM